MCLILPGRKDKDNCKRAPVTCALIDQIPDAKCTRGQVKFSVIQPGVHVWPHTGPTNCRLRAHLGLKIPDGPRIRVGNETRLVVELSTVCVEVFYTSYQLSYTCSPWAEGTQQASNTRLQRYQVSGRTSYCLCSSLLHVLPTVEYGLTLG